MSISDLGLQLDSLADMVTSGLVPALVLFHLFELAITPSWDDISMFYLILDLLVVVGFCLQISKV